MIHKRFLISLLICCLIINIQSSWVRTLTSQNDLTTGFGQNTKKVWVVYKGSSNNKALQNVAQIFRGMFQVATIDGSQQTLQVYGDDRSKPIKYSGEFNTDNIVKFVLSNVDEVINSRSEVARSLKANQQFQQRQAQRAKKQWEDEQQLRKKSDTIILNSDSWNTFVNGRQPWIINFYEGNCSGCIDLNKQWELIATEFKGKAKIAKINITQPGNEIYEEQIQLQKYPSVRFYKSGHKKVSDFVQFEGIHKRFSLQEWIKSKLNEKSTEVQLLRLNKQNYQSLCKATKNTCVIVFLENEDTDTLKKIEQLSLKHEKKPITFLVSKKGQQDQFAKQAQVTSYPNTVMVYYKQKKLYRMDGLDFVAIDQAIGQISLGNRNGFNKYKFEETIA